ncbi:MAG: right-handed parallel beta-helix repeat-containing protein, partial [Planctomycetota bacterium]
MKGARVIMAVAALLVASVLTAKSAGVTKTYTFDPNQSTVVEAFLTSETYNVSGGFQITYDESSGTFDWVDAILIDHPHPDIRDLGVLFYVDELVGEVVGETRIEFALPDGHPLRAGYDIEIVVNFGTAPVSMTGYRSPLMLGEPGYILEAVVGKVLYVDADAPPDGDGSSWATAFRHLQDALFNASPGTEIRVAEGVYKPHLNSYSAAPPSRGDTFQLINDVAVKGGYAGLGQPEPNARDIELYETILSGDMNADDVDVNDPCDLLDEPTRAENSYRIVTARGVDTSAVLEGFTITGGNADEGWPNYQHETGAGLYCDDNGSPTISNCTFSANSASNSGGGIHIAHSSPAITECIIKRNSANSGAGICCWSSSPAITDCIISDNHATWEGGGMNNDTSHPELTNCSFTGNSAQKNGGALYFWECCREPIAITNCVFRSNRSGDNGGAIWDGDSQLILTNCSFTANTAEHLRGGAIRSSSSQMTLIGCRFSNNSAAGNGGGISSSWMRRFTLSNCTFSRNSAGSGGGIYNEHNGEYGGTPTLTNCIFWADTPDEIYDHYSTTVVTYSDIQGGWPGDGNIDADPIFVYPGSGDYHLRPDSPCINAGDNSGVPPSLLTDLDGNPRIVNGIVDMGSYEFQGETRLIYVDDSATGANNGFSWADAYNYLQDALAAASSGDVIRVAQGVYKPDKGPGIAPGDRMATFQLINAVIIKGGYAGFGEPDPDARDVELYETVLSGDLVGNDVGDLYDASRSDNSYHVVTGSETDGTAVLDGVTITAGHASGPHSYGGGMFNESGSPTLTNCTFRGNSTFAEESSGGGGMFNYKGRPVLTNCIFSGNCADVSIRDHGSGNGGGIYNRDSNMVLIDCTFVENSAAGNDGGGMHNDGGSPILTNCAFTRNSAREYGGGISNRTGNPALTNCAFSDNSANGDHGGGGAIGISGNSTFTNCTFSGNSATRRGGGIHSTHGSSMFTNCMFSGNSAAAEGGGMFLTASSPTVINCTFAANSAANGSTFAFHSQHQVNRSNLTVTNCILWDGDDEIWNNDGSTITITYSDVQGGWPGEGNIDAGPLFVNAPGGDFHLQPASPCINAGDNSSVPPSTTTDLDGSPRIVHSVVDMGAYEFGGQMMWHVDVVGGDDSNCGLSRSEAFATIQKAIDRADDADAVLVWPGVYLEQVSFDGKAIMIRSADYPAVIEAPSQDAVSFAVGEGPGSVLSNFVIRNSATAIACNNESSPTLKNLTIVDNDFGIAAYENSDPYIRNCVFRNNRDGDLFECEAWYSCVLAPRPGNGNVRTDPMLADLEGGDYHLLCKTGRYVPAYGLWSFDSKTSPGVDGGDPSDNPMGERMPNGGRINMGAYGGTPYASMSEWPFTYDGNRDGRMDFEDF